MKLNINRNGLLAALAAVKPVAGRGSLPILSNLLLVGKGNDLTIAVSSIASPVKDRADLILPAKTVRELLRLLSSDTDKPNRLQVAIGENQVQFAFGDITILSKLIEGTYPDWNRIIPADNNIATLPRAELLRSVERIALVADDIHMEFTGSALHLKSHGKRGNELVGDATDCLLIASNVKPGVPTECVFSTHRTRHQTPSAPRRTDQKAGTGGCSLKTTIPAVGTEMMLTGQNSHFRVGSRFRITDVTARDFTTRLLNRGQVAGPPLKAKLKKPGTKITPAKAITAATPVTEAGVAHCVADGRTSQKRRGQLSAQFKLGPGRAPYQVMLAGVESMAEGHSYPMCNNVILMCYSWAYDKFEQAINRAHRINSLWNVNV